MLNLTLQKPAPRNAFTGAFFEISTGLVNNHHISSGTSQDTINYSATLQVQGGNTRFRSIDTGTRSGGGSGDENKNEWGERLVLGYGMTFGSFNLAPSLFYLPNSFSFGGNSLKNTWGLQLQPGFYLPLNKQYFRDLLLYGTVGFASTKATINGAPQSDTVCTSAIRPNVSGTAFYYSPICDPATRFPAVSQTSQQLNGLVLGTGAKLAFSDRVYGVFDFTYILYNKLKGNDLHQTKQVNGNGQYAVLDTGATTGTSYNITLTRDYGGSSGGRIHQTLIFIGAGFRFY